MFFTLGSAVRGCASVAFLAIISSASAQAPSQAQRDAIKKQCRSDYVAHCSSIPPGGEASLECLQKNMSSLSASCATAVRAVSAPAAAPKAADPAAKPRTDMAPPASKPPTATPKAAAAPAASAGTAAVVTPQPIALRPLRPREEIRVLRSACSGDVRSLCGTVPPGEGRIVQCLASNGASLSSGCRDVLAPFAQR